MKISILTIFPEMIQPMVECSILGRAVKKGILEIEIVNIRDFSDSKHKNTDDYPFGGGVGMLMMPQPIFSALESVKTNGCVSIYMSPQGQTLTPEIAKELSTNEHLVILCGHYEGVDQRVLDNAIDREISIGDYVLTGGELAALVVVDAVSRFVDGVLGSVDSAYEDSFSDGLLEAPQYTRPADYNGLKVPEVLLSGNHAKITLWQREMQLRTTLKKRPDLLKTAQLSDEDVKILEKIKKE
ncbi:MAG: tRNA (guanosine(37)-N1)-methyltransferase TrmD [Clostridia bacterium]|nr:tRNA (guanosine(37)-N1)-methyltransferase TrmD [Clostridia bacterium]